MQDECGQCRCTHHHNRCHRFPNPVHDNNLAASLSGFVCSDCRRFSACLCLQWISGSIFQLLVSIAPSFLLLDSINSFFQLNVDQFFHFQCNQFFSFFRMSTLKDTLCMDFYFHVYFSFPLNDMRFLFFLLHLGKKSVSKNCSFYLFTIDKILS